MGRGRFVTVDDYEPAAREVLDDATYGYFAGGAGDERTINANRRTFDRWCLRPRVLRGVGSPDTSTEVLGTRIENPVLVAPWASQWLAHGDGELGTARGTAAAGTIMVVSSTVLDRVEEIATAGAPLWWQVYVFTDREVTADHVRRAAAAGYRAIVLTVDVPVLGLRHRDARTGFELPVGAKAAELVFDDALTWDDLAWLRAQAPELPLVVKGVMREDDALMAVEHGADAIIVSNHGGRQLDAGEGGLDAVPPIVDAVAGRVPVLVDGGVRRGTDVVTALALGASAVLVARPIAWGLAVAGEEGVADVLRILREETANVMAQCGARTVAEITPDLVAPAP
ncbi:MAG TPA: alpha-hydroxy acid oxidase [Actinomycetota bacterium]|nr:alpha-hydroxy acid oxidase [Actinomycetota bacterium]